MYLLKYMMQTSGLISVIYYRWSSVPKFNEIILIQRIIYIFNQIVIKYMVNEI